MPMAMPDDASGPAHSRQNEAGSEYGYRERLAPRERRDKCGGHTVTLKILPKLPDVRVYASDTFLSVHCGDHQSQGRLTLVWSSARARWCEIDVSHGYLNPPV